MVVKLDMYPKAYLLHIYYENNFLETKNFSSQTLLKRYLRDNGVKFPNFHIQNIEEDMAVTLTKGSFQYEIEEDIEDNRKLTINGIEYVCLSLYRKLTNQTYRQVNYQFKTGKIKGIYIGKNGYRYIPMSEVKRWLQTH